MKSIILFCFLSCFVSLSAQIDTIAFKDFFSDVDHIELCELKPFMKTHPETKGHFRARVVTIDTSYSTQTVVYKDSIDFSRIGNKCVGDRNVTTEIEGIILNKTHDNMYEIMCYNPRNGILFYNRKNELIGFLEVCFECQQNVGYLIPKIDLNEDQFKALKKVFLREGLKVTD